MDTTEDAGGGSAVEGYLTLLPYFATADGTVDAAIALMAPWGAPLLSGMRGKMKDGEPVLSLVYESPQSWLRLGERMSKGQLELFHIQRLAIDCRAATGQELFLAVEPGSDPPDMRAFVDGGSAGWELTAFALQQRHLAQALFAEVRRRVANQQRHRVGHLTGFFVHMWFGSAADPASLPYQKSDETALEALVESLVAHRPDPDQFKVREGELPQVFPWLPVHGPSDVTYCAIPLLGGVPTSPLYCLTGFEIGLAFQSEHTASEEWARLKEVVSRKDKPGNDVLLISAGAPDRTGTCYPAEEVVISLLLEHPQTVEAQHLKSVIVHFWSSGRAVEILHSQQELWPPLYGGIMPSHQPFLPSPGATATTG